MRLLHLVIGLKDSHHFFNQWEAKPRPSAPCTSDSSRALSELQVVAWYCDWFTTLFAPVVIGRSNCFGFGFFDSHLKTALYLKAVITCRWCLAYYFYYYATKVPGKIQSLQVSRPSPGIQYGQYSIDGKWNVVSNCFTQALLITPNEIFICLFLWVYPIQ